MKIQPYLFFQGRCDEALDLYKAVFDADLKLLMRYRESPEAPPMPLPPGWEEKVMHAELRIGETVLMASDGCGSEAPGFEGFSLSVDMPNAEAARRAFDALAEGGAVRMPLDKTFFAPCFGMLTDRFGVGWMLIVNEQP